MTTFAADPFGICFIFGIVALFVGQGNNRVFDILQEHDYTPNKDNQFLFSILVLLFLTTFLFFVTLCLDHYTYEKNKTTTGVEPEYAKSVDHRCQLTWMLSTDDCRYDELHI